MATKKTIKTEPAKTEAPKQAEAFGKWVAGKYRMLRTYCGTLGVFHAGKEYELTKEQAEAFGKAGEIEKCL